MHGAEVDGHQLLEKASQKRRGKTSDRKRWMSRRDPSAGEKAGEKTQKGKKKRTSGFTRGGREEKRKSSSL